MDPGLAYTVAAWQIMWNVYGGLLGYTHANGAAGATLVPYLAQSLPKITNGGKTYTFMLRKGLKYSNGQPIKASDFPYTIERDFKMDSPGVGFFSVIKGVSGANGYATTKKGHISGISANDATGKITITLDNPEADFANILATEFAAFVPNGTPATDQSAKGGPPADGPYMVKSYNATRSFTIVRNRSSRRRRCLPSPAATRTRWSARSSPTRPPRWRRCSTASRTTTSSRSRTTASRRSRSSTERS